MLPLALGAAALATSALAGDTLHLTSNRARSARFSPDPAVRFAWAQRQVLDGQAKYARYAGVDESEVLRRDMEQRDAAEEFARRAVGSTQMYDWGRDSQYTAKIQVGTPAQEFDVVVDTGSSDLWLLTACTNATECGGIPLYDPTKSSSYQKNGTAYSIQYAQGSSTGVWGSDAVTFAGASKSEQLLGLVDNVELWNNAGTDITGLIGMGWTATGSGPVPFWQSLAPSWSDKQFGIWLARETVTLNGGTVNGVPTKLIENGGSITLGGVDTSLFTGQLNYLNVPVAQDGQPTYWQVPLDNMVAFGQTINTDSSSGFLSSSTSKTNAVIDTGTTLMYVPSDIANSFWSSVSGAFMVQGMPFYPCDTIPNFGLGFTLGGQTYYIAATDLIASTYTTAELEGLLGSRLSGNYKQWCQGGMVGGSSSSSSSTPPFLLGDVFIKNVYTAFRYDPPSIGFAPLSAAANNSFGPNGAANTAAGGGAAATGAGASSTGSGSGSGSGSSGQSAATRAEVGVSALAIGAVAALVLAL